MNKNLEKALRDQKIRNQIKETVSKARSVTTLDEANLYTTFVQPFSDVFSALKIFSKDVISSAMLITGQILTLSPKKQKERMKNFEERQKKIEAEWKPLMDRADAALGSGDADIVALAFSPGTYLVSTVGAKAYDAAEGVGKYLDDLGLKKGFLSVLPGVSDTSVASGGDSSKSSDEKEDSSLLDKLNRLFWGTAVVAGVGAYGLGKLTKNKEAKKENLERRNSILNESSGDLAKDTEKFLSDTGASVEFESMQDNLTELYKDYIEQVDSDYESRKSFVDTITKSSTVDELLQSLKSIENTDLAEEAEKIRKSYEDSKGKLLSSEDFKKSVSEQIGSEEVSSQQVAEYADKALFADFMTNITDSLKKNLEDTKQKIGEELSKKLPTQKSLDIAKTTKKGIPFFNMIRDAKVKYNIS